MGVVGDVSQTKTRQPAWVYQRVLMLIWSMVAAFPVLTHAQAVPMVMPPPPLASADAPAGSTTTVDTLTKEQRSCESQLLAALDTTAADCEGFRELLNDPRSAKIVLETTPEHAALCQMLFDAELFRYLQVLFGALDSSDFDTRQDASDTLSEICDRNTAAFRLLLPYLVSHLSADNQCSEPDYRLRRVFQKCELGEWPSSPQKPRNNTDMFFGSPFYFTFENPGTP